MGLLMKKQATFFIVAVGLLVSSLIGLAQVKPKIVMLDIGQGDSIYIRTPAGQDILVDAGRGGQALEKLAEVMPRGDDTLEIIIASHMDADHIGGFKKIMEKYKVKQAFYNADTKKTSTAQDFLDSVRRHNVPLREIYEGQRIESTNFTMDILWPPKTGTKKREEIENKSNNFSIVSRIKSGNKKILLTADLPAPLEQELLNEHLIGRQTVLQVPHHGSKFSSSLSLLKITAPEYFWISVGANNRYGHPAAEVLKRLNLLPGTIKRTDKNGDQKVLFN